MTTLLLEPSLPTNPVERTTSDEVTIVDTTELRWFANGDLPAHVVSWFTGQGAAGVHESRCDTYRVDDRCDIGVKCRFGDTLELKIRRSIEGFVVLGSGLAAPLETWRRWSPAGGRVELGLDDDWIDVHKEVFKRRFSSGGDEIVWSNGAPPDIGAGCDVEVAAVTVAGVEAWTFALAAFGPSQERRDALATGWQAISPDRLSPAWFETSLSRPGGYPQWLADFTAPIRDAEVWGRLVA